MISPEEYIWGSPNKRGTKWMCGSGCPCFLSLSQGVKINGQVDADRLHVADLSPPPSAFASQGLIVYSLFECWRKQKNKRGIYQVCDKRFSSADDENRIKVCTMYKQVQALFFCVG